MKKTIILSLLSFTTLAGHADEGMWMLTDLKEQNAATTTWDWTSALTKYIAPTVSA